MSATYSPSTKIGSAAVSTYRGDRRHGTKVDKDGGSEELDGTVTHETAIGAVIGSWSVDDVQKGRHGTFLGYEKFMKPLLELSIFM